MKKIHAIGSGVILLLFITGISLAGEFDYNPGQEAIKYKHEMTDDVTGEGYVKEYKRIIALSKHSFLNTINTYYFCIYPLNTAKFYV